MAIQDKVLSCRDCNQDFTFTVSEQEFFSAKGFQNDPSRCVDCRASRKARIATQSGFESGGAQSTSGYSFGGGGSTSYSSNGRREYTKATCASCGGEALLPFVPRGDKPVYCSNCFDKVRTYR